MQPKKPINRPLITGPQNPVASITPVSPSSLDESTASAVARETAPFNVLLALNTREILEKWKPDVTQKVASRYVQALDTPEVLWTIVACQLVTGVFPDQNDALRIMSLMDSESSFRPSVYNSFKAYGLMQVMPANVKNISAWPLDDKEKYIKPMLPVANWMGSIDPAIKADFTNGRWPSSLIHAAPLWQIPFVAILWAEAARDLKNSFTYSVSAGWKPKAKVVNQTWLKYMRDNPSIFKSFEDGKTAIFAHLWKHGGPNGLYKNVRLVYLGHGVDLISPIVERYHNLDTHSVVPGAIHDLIQMLYKLSASS